MTILDLLAVSVDAEPPCRVSALAHQASQNQSCVPSRDLARVVRMMRCVAFLVVDCRQDDSVALESRDQD